MEEHHDPRVAPQPFAVAAAKTRLLQVELKLVVYSRPQRRIPLHTEPESSEMCKVRIGEVVPLAGDTEIERPARASDEWGSATVGGGDQPAM